jgi:uncharacterized membrane protein YcaP (DUF421 family)
MTIDFPALGVIALKSMTIYLFIVLAIRLFGKRELAQLSVFDLVFILLISNSVQNAMVGPDNTLWGGIAAATGLFVINHIFKLVIRQFPQLGIALQGHSIMLIYEGKVIDANLQKAMFTLDELEAAVREHGVQTIKEVDLAVLEVDGNISVLSKNFQHKTTRKRKAHKVVAKQG